MGQLMITANMVCQGDVVNIDCSSCTQNQMDEPTFQ